MPARRLGHLIQDPRQAGAVGSPLAHCLVFRDREDRFPVFLTSSSAVAGATARKCRLIIPPEIWYDNQADKIVGV